VEQARNEVCFKTGLVGFHMTLTFDALNKLLTERYAGNLAKMEAELDANYGCLPQSVEDSLLYEMKRIKHVGDFQKYYQKLGRPAMDEQALSLRLRQAIDNSKTKKYHGSSEHMNELPTMPEQTAEMLEAHPSPFDGYDEASKSFKVAAGDARWKSHCMEKFGWVKEAISSNYEEFTPSQLAMRSDKREMEKRTWNVKETEKLHMHNVKNNKQGQDKAALLSQSSCDEYPAQFNWRNLFHKLCFEQMLDFFGQSLDFQLLYKYINALGSEIPVLRVHMVKKTHLKSNNYWIMALVGKMPALEVLKFHNRQALPFGADGWKYLSKGMNYLAQNGRKLKSL
jgi:hypothetical protein